MPKLQIDGHPILEVIVTSLSDALEAERGGADRLEVVRDLACGGLTPELSLVRAIARVVSLPLRVMIREHETNSASGDDEQLRAAALELEQIGVDGLVIGFIRGESIDLGRTLNILEAVPQLRATFHHAFDEAASPLEAITHLAQYGNIDRILTSGAQGNLTDRANRLEQYRQRAGEKIVILAGGGLDETSIPFLRAHTGICEFHVGRAARALNRNDGAVRADLVKRLREVLCCSDRSVFELPGGGGRK